MIFWRKREAPPAPAAPRMTDWEPPKNEEKAMAERREKVWRVDVAAEGGASVLLVKAKTEKRAVDFAVARHLKVREATYEDAAAIGRIEEAT